MEKKSGESGGTAQLAEALVETARKELGRLDAINALCDVLGMVDRVGGTFPPEVTGKWALETVRVEVLRMIHEYEQRAHTGR